MAYRVRHAQIVLFVVNAWALTACLSSKDDPGTDGADAAAGGGASAEGGRSGGNGSGGNAGSGGNGGSGGSGGSGGNAGSAGTPGTTGGASGMAGGGGGSGLIINGPAPTANVDFGLDTRPTNTTCKDPGRPTGQPNDPFPQMLGATGCFSAANPKQPTAGLIPYDVASPLWSDNAEKQRYMALPEGKKIKITDTGDFEFPVGTVLLKTFALNGAMLETRFLIRHSDRQWGTYTYVWNEAGTDAKLQGEASDSRFFGNDEWVFPSRTDCVGCHTAPVGRSIGPETRQMNSVFEYGPNKRANQLKTLDHLNMFETKLGDVTKLPALPTPKYAVGATLEQRARSYLHANCSHCHQPGGTPDAMGKDQVSIDFRFDTPFKMMGVCNVPPSKNNYGFADIMLLTPGNAEMDAGRGYLKKSMISVRMHSTTDKVRMPQIGTKVPDKLGTQIVDEWIKSLAVCPP